MVAVKEERPDEAEIQALAEKMKEANKAKMAAPAAATAPSAKLALAAGPGGQSTLVRGGGAASTVKLPEEKKPIDEESQRGRFGWFVLGTIPIPYILRQGEMYCAVRMVESKLLNKFLSYLHSDIYNYTNIRSYYITDAESRILNEINLRHCDAHFGRDHFTNKDLVVRLQDAIEFYTFLEICYNKLNYNTLIPSNRCGFIRINNESVVPFTVKENVKYVPLFYFEGETDSLKMKAEMLEGWDLAYLKFCCKVQGIRNELFASETCSVISLDDIMSYFPSGTQFDDYWPAKVTDCPLISKNPVANASWTRQPAGAVPVAAAATKPSAPHSRSFPQNANPPTAGTPGAAAASLPSRTLWNSMVQQQQQQSQNIARMAQAMASQRQQQQWQPPQASQYYNYHPGLVMQQQQTAPTQKAHPPPLVRTPASSTQANQNLNHMAGNSMATVSKSMMMNRTAISTYNGYNATPVGADVMDLSGQQGQTATPTFAMNARKGTDRMVQIDEVASPTGNLMPYQVQKALVEGKLVPCINSEPYRYSELLMTLPDFTTHFFPNITPGIAQKILQDVLKVTLFKGNRQQIDLMRQTGKCRSEKDAPALMQVRDVMQYMPQLKYVLNNKIPLQSESASKRMRIS